MRSDVIVFDFDKTLTNKDTLFGFYRMIDGQNPLFRLKQILLIGAAAFYKSGFITNDILKKIGISLFLKGKTRGQLETVAEIYASQIDLNDVYYDHYRNSAGDKWIISASPEVYLKHVFPGGKVVGTTLKFHGERVAGLGVNMFGREKKRFLERISVHNINALYTDSMTDEDLAEIAERVYIVNRGNIVHRRSS